MVTSHRVQLELKGTSIFSKRGPLFGASYLPRVPSRHAIPRLEMRTCKKWIVVEVVGRLDKEKR